MLMKVFKSNADPLHRPARLSCLGRISIDGSTAAWTTAIGLRLRADGAAVGRSDARARREQGKRSQHRLKRRYRVSQTEISRGTKRRAEAMRASRTQHSRWSLLRSSNGDRCIAIRTGCGIRATPTVAASRQISRFTPCRAQKSAYCARVGPCRVSGGHRAWRPWRVC